MIAPKDDIEQARANMLKTIRAAVRLKYSLLADEELNQLLPRAELRFNAAVQRQQLPTPVEIKKSLGL